MLGLEPGAIWLHTYALTHDSGPSLISERSKVSSRVSIPLLLYKGRNNETMKPHLRVAGCSSCSGSVWTGLAVRPSGGTQGASFKEEWSEVNPWMRPHDPQRD